jgi:hypothetical protein
VTSVLSGDVVSVASAGHLSLPACVCQGDSLGSSAHAHASEAC